MRRRYLLFLVFLMFLYIAPTNLMPYSTIPANVTDENSIKEFILTSDYSVVLAADEDDDYWLNTTPEVTHYIIHDQCKIREVGYAVAGMRFLINVPKDATINSATLSAYEYENGDPDDDDAEIFRYDEDNIGPLEDDNDIPTLALGTYGVFDFNGVVGWSLNNDITDIVQEGVNEAYWDSGDYMGFQINQSTADTNSWFRLDDYSNARTNHAYINITYTVTGGDAPENAATPTCSNLDDTDNMYPAGKEYEITVNATDPDGFDAIDYVELALWTNSRGAELWRVRFDEDTAVFSEQYDPNDIISLNTTASTNSSSGNNVNATFFIEIDTDHPAAWDVDARQYVLDNETDSDTDWYEVDWDIGAENGWLSGWNRRKSHLIEQTSGTDYNYSVPLWTYFDSPPPMGDDDNNVGLNSSAELDFGDIRWTGPDGTTLLDYNLNLTEDYGGNDFYTNDAIKFDRFPGNRPGSWYYNGRTYVVYHGPKLGDEENIAGDPYILYYDHENETWSGKVRIGSNPMSGDDHGSPCLFINNTGHIHVFFGSHNGPVNHSVSTNPEDISSWTHLPDVFSGTYPHLSYDSDNNVAHAYMRADIGGTDFLGYWNSSDGGQTWTGPQYVVEMDPVNPYMEGAGGIDPYNNELLHVAFNLLTGGDVIDVYYLYVNVTTGNIYNASGDYQGVSITSQSVLDNCKVYDTGSYEAWGPSVHVDANSTPYIIWSQDDASGDDSTRFSYWTGSAWSAYVEITEPRRYSAPSDFIVYDSSNITAFLADYNDMYEFYWDGVSWTQGTSMKNSTNPPIDPNPPGAVGVQLSFSMVPHGTPGGIGSHNATFQCTFSEWPTSSQRTWRGTVHVQAWAWGVDGLVKSDPGKRAKFWVTVEVNLTEYDAYVYVYYDKNGETTTSEQLAYVTGNDPDHGDWGSEEYQPPTGNAPTNDQTPSCSNLDDTDNMYSEYKQYIVAANCSDVDGFTDLYYLDIGIWNNLRDTMYWVVRFDEDTATFSEQSDTSNILTLDVGSCSNTSSGNALNITIVFTIHWNHSDIVDLDIRQYVRDADANSDLDWYEVDWDIESDVTTTFTLSDGSGTTDRGNINGIDTITASGTVTYQGSSLYPPSDTADVWINCTDVAGQPWSDTTLTSGAWSVTVDADDVVGLDTYWAYVVEEGSGMTGTHVNATSATDTYIADQIIVQGWHTDDDPDLRINVGSSLNVTVWLQYVHDSTNVTDGTVTVNKGSMSYVGAGNWSYIWTEVVVADHLLHDVQCSGNTHGITTEDQNGLWLLCIWDRLLIDIQADNEDVGNGIQVDFTLTVTFDYDDTECTSYTIQIARNGTNWYVFTYGNRSLFNDTNSDAVYLYNATSSGANVTDFIHGLTIFITNTETVTWAGGAPVNNETPSSSNLDDTDNLYAWYREYIILTNHSDEDGFGDIHHIQFSLWDDTRTTEYFRLDFNEDTATFSKLVEDVANMITLNITSCSNSSSGIYLNITWHIWIHWNFTPAASDSDSWLYVNDTVGTSDIDWYETDWDPITTCSVSVSYLDDGIGTADRGTYGLNDSIWANGTLSYLTGVGGGDNYPPADRIDLWVNSSACSYSPWSVTSYDDSTGAFSVLVDSGDSPKTSPDTYQVTAVEEGGAFDSDNFVNGGTDDYKPDVIEVTAFTQSLGRIDIDTTASMAIELRYHYDSTYVTSGSFSCNGTAMSYNGGSLRWDLLPTKSTVQGINYSSVIGADANIGVAVVNMSGFYKFQIWDRLVIDIQADDESPYNDQEVRFTLTVTYDYDDSTCTTYTIQIDRNATNWYVFTNSNKTLFDDTNANVLYLYNASSSGAGIWDYTYGLTAFTTNIESVRWSATGEPDWNLLPTVGIWFTMLLDVWGLNTAIMIMGLIMIPVSTLYLVRGGRKDMSNDKFFFFLMIFFVGWALFLGGIMP